MLCPELLQVSKLPRAPFLRHSEELLEYLLSFAAPGGGRVLEIGCGRRSPLLQMLKRLLPDADVHQIDALPDVVADAAQNNPQGKVEQLLASDMSTIASGSQQLVIAMSVLDQNSEQLLSQIASEIHRVLSPAGLAIYIHNEELNLPATAASMFGRGSVPRLLLPNERWQPTNDLEYCSGDKSEIDAAVSRLGADGALLHRYLRGVFPQVYGDRVAQSGVGKIAAPFLRECSVPVMNRMRAAVSLLREDDAVSIADHHTGQLLSDHVEGRLFCEQHGFEVLRSGVFEARRCVPWRTVFKERPATSHFVRGITRFGYSSGTTPQPLPEYDQELNSNPARADGEIQLIAYQYGLIARKH